MREVIVWPIRVWLTLILLNLSIVLAIGVVLTDKQLIGIFLTLLTLTIIFWSRTRLEIVFQGDRIKVGRAAIDKKYVQEILILNEDDMRRERGVALNPRAFLALRFWIKGGIKITLNDSRDPTPYWLVSTREGERIKELLTANS